MLTFLDQLLYRTFVLGGLIKNHDVHLYQLRAQGPFKTHSGFTAHHYLPWKVKQK